MTYSVSSGSLSLYTTTTTTTICYYSLSAKAVILRSHGGCVSVICQVRLAWYRSRYYYGVLCIVGIRPRWLWSCVCIKGLQRVLHT